jgi:hypothetical protein
MRSHRLPKVPSAGGRPDGVVVEASEICRLWLRIHLTWRANHVPYGRVYAGSAPCSNDQSRGVMALTPWRDRFKSIARKPWRDDQSRRRGRDSYG